MITETEVGWSIVFRNSHLIVVHYSLHKLRYPCLFLSYHLVLLITTLKELLHFPMKPTLFTITATWNRFLISSMPLGKTHLDEISCFIVVAFLTIENSIP